MAKKFDRIEAKIDHIVERIGSIDSTLTGQAIQLKEHIKRTSLLEQALTPVKSKVDQAEGVLRFIGWLAVALAGLEGLRILVQHL